MRANEMEAGMKSAIPKRYYDDILWAYRHFFEWRNKYGNKWIAVFNHKVIAWGKNVGSVEKQLREKSIKTRFTPIMFVEKGAYVY